VVHDSPGERSRLAGRTLLHLDANQVNSGELLVYLQRKKFQPG
jgi:hypothetical protein